MRLKNIKYNVLIINIMPQINKLFTVEICEKNVYLEFKYNSDIK